MLGPQFTSIDNANVGFRAINSPHRRSAKGRLYHFNHRTLRTAFAVLRTLAQFIRNHQGSYRNSTTQCHFSLQSAGHPC
jgi:hypothetical protein